MIKIPVYLVIITFLFNKTKKSWLYHNIDLLRITKLPNFNHKYLRYAVSFIFYVRKQSKIWVFFA